MSIFSFLSVYCKVSLADEASHFQAASQFVQMTFNKKAFHENAMRYELLAIKDKYENNPQTKPYSDVIINAIMEVMDAYLNDADTQNKVKKVYSQIYMQEFTETELLEMISFYSSKVGQKAFLKLPVILKKQWEQESHLPMPAKYEQMITDKLKLLQQQGKLPAEFGAKIDLCNEYVDKKQYSLAIRACTKKINEGTPGSSDYYNRGTAYLNSGEYIKAIADFNNSIRLAPESFAAYNNRGSAYAALREIQKAITDFNKAIELSPYSSAPYYNRGNAYKSIGNTKQALADFNKAVDLGDKDPLAYYNRGGYYSETGNYEQAIDDYSQALKIDNEFEFAYGNRGLAYGKIGQYEKAIEDFNTAIKLNPKRADNYYNRGIAFHKIGKKAEAFKDYKTSAKLGYEPAQDFLKTQGIDW